MILHFKEGDKNVDTMLKEGIFHYNSLEKIIGTPENNIHVYIYPNSKPKNSGLVEPILMSLMSTPHQYI